jgi:hypothetical protein
MANLKEKPDVLRLPAEELYAHELEALISSEKDPFQQAGKCRLNLYSLYLWAEKPGV